MKDEYYFSDDSFDTDNEFEEWEQDLYDVMGDFAENEIEDFLEGKDD